jgi:protein tyrosine phosphatase (PTP) superfamily phosphohydrolase (DUF442 family)
MHKKNHPHPKRRIALGLLLSAIAAAGGLYWHHSGQPYHFGIVTPGVLYRSGTLTPAHLESVLKQYGIRTVVNLRSPDGEGPPDWHRHEAAVCTRQGVKLVDLPMHDDRAPAPDQIAKWIDLFNIKSGLPLLVHCKSGVVRTGMMVALYEIEYLGLDPHRALEELPAFGHDLKSADYQFLRDLILNYTPHQKNAPQTSQ